MRLNRRIRLQLAVFLTVSVTAMVIIAFGYMRLPSLLFGSGRYTVTVELSAAAGLYENGNVTYRGTEVGRVTEVRLSPGGVEAVLSLRSDVAVPSDLVAEVHSQSAVGEQYVALIPRSDGPPLKDGDVIPLSRSTVPPAINRLVDGINRGLRAIPQDNLRTTVDESYTAVGGLGPELSRIVDGSTTLAIDARDNLDALTSLIDGAGPVLDAQADNPDAIQAWSAQLANITAQLRNHDTAVAGVLEHGAPAANEVHHLLDRLNPTLPVLLANLVSVNKVAITYRNDIEQLLVLLPQGVQVFQATLIPNLNTKQDTKGLFLSFNTNILPPPCMTGYLPPQQRRSPVFEDYPDRPADDLYCRVPQDSPLNVRGMRNIPCETVPGKRAPTVKMCESDENYVPLNDGTNWKGDPNATSSGQNIPQPNGIPVAPPVESSPAPVAAAQYDPSTGTYIGPDGRVYTQSDLANTTPKESTWQSMLLPPVGH